MIATNQLLLATKRKQATAGFTHIGSRTEHVARALSAYYSHGSKLGGVPEHPSSTSYECGFRGRRYVVLEHTNRVLAVYRIKPDGFLQRLREWPKGIEPKATEVTASN